MINKILIYVFNISFFNQTLNFFYLQYVLFSLENFSLAQPDPSEGLGKPRHGAANDFRTSAFSQNIKSLFTMTN